MAVPEADAPAWSALLDDVRQKLEVSPDVPLLGEGPDALWGCLVRNLGNATPFTVVWDVIAWAKIGGRHTANYPQMRDSFRESYNPLVYIKYDDTEMLRLYHEKYKYNEFFNDRNLQVRLLSRSRSGPLP